MQKVVKTKVRFRRGEDGWPERVEIPYEKTVFDEEDKIRIVSEYVQSREPAQKVIERYHLSSKQVLFNWMDKYLHEESLSLSSEQNTNPMANKNPEERIRELEEENKRLTAKVASLMDALAWQRKRVYGQMSEKHLPVDPNQLNLFTKEEMSEMERKSVEQETEKEERTITRTITVKEKPARRDLNLEGLPVTEHHIYPEGTTDENGALKSDYVEIGTEESSRLELTPAKLCVAKTIRHKVILKSELEDKQPEERKIMIAPMTHQPTEPPSCTHSLAPARPQEVTRESGWLTCSASCLITSVTANMWLSYCHAHGKHYTRTISSY